MVRLLDESGSVDEVQARGADAADGHVDAVAGAHRHQRGEGAGAEGDGPVYQLREWYQQFFMDEADVPASFAERREIVTVDQRK
ncbi:hypothetical protein SF06_10810 [Pseudomonas flexibilis]|nr:hypothetical protein SF06_10810 [Pseudomonas flexibilis]